jgi:hypothetical protein
MRTALNIPEEFLAQAKEIAGFQSNTDVIIYSLKELIRRHNLEILKAMSGKIQIEIDIDSMRRRRIKREV